MVFYKLTESSGMIQSHYANIGCYFKSENEVILIDTGHVHESKAVLEFVLEQGWQVIGIINTHGHIDHVGSNTILQRHFNCQIAIPYVDHIFVEDIKRYYMSFSTSVVEGLDVYGDGTFECHYLIKEETQFSFCGLTFGVVPLPGHTFNQKGIITPDGIAFLGDGLIDIDIMKKSKFPVVTNIGWHLQTLDTIRELDYKMIVIGHGDVIRSKETLIETVDENRLYFMRKVDEVEHLLKTVDSFDGIMFELNKIYGIRKNIFKYFVAERTIRSILSFLEASHRIQILVEDGVMRYKVNLG